MKKNRNLDQKQNFLCTQLLKSVARSFYLSLRFLPKIIRTPLSIAYLLARATDTIADTKELPISLRTQLLMSLKSMISNIHEPNALNRLQKAVIPLQTQANEKLLIENLHYCLDLLSLQNELDK